MEMLLAVNLKSQASRQNKHSRKVFNFLLRLKGLFCGMVVSGNVKARAGADSGHLVSTEQAGQCHCAALCDMSHRHTDTRRCVTCHTDITTPHCH